jgi:hypothetical protein
MRTVGYFICLSVLFAFSAQGQSWGDKGMSPSFTQEGYATFGTPIPMWQLQGAPADEDATMEQKRFPKTAQLENWVYWGYVNSSGKKVFGEKKLRAVSDWTDSLAKSTLAIKFKGKVYFTIVGKVPGYAKTIKESVFINDNDKFFALDELGQKCYKFVMDYDAKKVYKLENSWN